MQAKPSGPSRQHNVIMGCKLLPVGSLLCTWLLVMGLWKQGAAVQHAENAWRDVPPQTTPGSCSPPSPLPPGLNFTSSWGLRASSCAWFRVSSDSLQASKNPACSRPGSLLVFEFWALSWTASKDKQTTTDDNTVHVADGLYMLAAPQVLPQIDLSTLQDSTDYKWSSKCPTCVLDDAALKARLPYQHVRFMITHADLAGYSTWFMTIANANAGRKLERFSVKVDCHPSPASLPCPSPSVKSSQCSSSESHGNCIRTHTLYEQSERCVCAEGWAGFACSVPVSNTITLTLPESPDGVALTSYNLPASLPGTWTYLLAKVPDKAVLHVELSQPPGSGAYVDPVLVVQPAQMQSQRTGLTWDEPAPSLANITFLTHQSAFDVKQDYASLTFRTTKYRPYDKVQAVWIAIFNAALDGTSVPAEVPVLNLVVRVSQADGVGLCPKDCSGKGACVRALTSSDYQCVCQEGVSGPWCQGRLSSHVVTQDREESGPQPDDGYMLQPGEWSYHQITLGSAVINSINTRIQEGLRSDNPAGTLLVSVQVAWSGSQPGGDLPGSAASHGDWQRIEDQPSPSLTDAHVLMILTPFDSQTSRGDRFFNRQQTQLSMNGGILKVPIFSVPEGSFMLAMYNSPLESTRPVRYRACTTWIVTPSDTLARATFINRSRGIPWITLCLGLASAGIAILTCCCLCTRMMLRRRAARRNRRGEEDQAATEAVGPDNPKGVPVQIISMYPLLAYQSEQELDAFIMKTQADMKTRAGSGTSAAQPTAGADLPSAANTKSGAGQGADMPATTNSSTSGAEVQLAEWRPAPSGKLAGERAGPGAGPGAGTLDTWSRRTEGSSQARCCAICIVELERGDMLRVLLPCAHPFHQVCIDKWLKKKDSCPICRTNLKDAAQQYNLVSDGQALSSMHGSEASSSSAGASSSSSASSSAGGAGGGSGSQASGHAASSAAGSGDDRAGGRSTAHTSDAGDGATGEHVMQVHQHRQEGSRGGGDGGGHAGGTASDAAVMADNALWDASDTSMSSGVPLAHRLGQQGNTQEAWVVTVPAAALDGPGEVKAGGSGAARDSNAA